MPARDGTGPLGRGSMTGRGLGTCVASAGSRFMSGRGRGLGLGLGLGLGCLRYLRNTQRNRFDDTGSALEEQEAMLEQALSDVRRQIGR
jgi:hypothetical protein